MKNLSLLPELPNEFKIDNSGSDPGRVAAEIVKLL